MEFNIQKYLTENKLTGQSQMREEDNTGLTMHIGDDYEDMMQHDDDEEEENMDDWSTSDSHDGNYDQEPTAQDIAKPEPALTGIHKKQAQLQGLEAQKDALLMQYKSGHLGLDQYKEKIGNIPNQIKKLRADVDKAMTVTADDGSEDEMA